MSFDNLPVASRVANAMKSGSWWTPAEIATKTDDSFNSVVLVLDLMLATKAVQRRHIGSDRRGDLYAYRLSGAA